MNNQNLLLWVLIAAGAYFLFNSDEPMREGERLYEVNYTSPDEEFIYTEQVAAKNEKAAIAQMKSDYKAKGEVLRGGTWDAERA